VAFVLAVLAALSLLHPVMADPVRGDHLEAELVAELDAVQPGRSLWVGLRMKLDDHWHIYWRNPGDAGTPPAITWDLPPGFVAGDIEWPVPERIELPPLANYGYEGEFILPVEMNVPDEVDAARVTLRASVDWLACKDVCIPGRASLELILPVSEVAAPDPRWNDLFVSAHEGRPLDVDELDRAGEWRFEAVADDDALRLAVVPPPGHHPDLDDLAFYPHAGDIIDHAAPQIRQVVDGAVMLTIPQSSYRTEPPAALTGILVTPEGWRGMGTRVALTVDLPVTRVADVSLASPGDGTGTEEGSGVLGRGGAPESGGTGGNGGVLGSGGTEGNGGVRGSGAGDDAVGLPLALAFAFVGGLILNLMPCVLPVLSLKILGFVHQARAGHGTALTHGLLFAAGVVISFWVLAGVLIALRAGGEQLGWGFQLQSPPFLIVLSGILFAMGLNLLGVFEIPGVSLGSGTEGTGRTGSFLNGVTATVVATPCTAPFMGSALGFSLAQPPAISLLVFTVLGLGMAAPYVVLSAFPVLLRRVPRPGPWMETLKHVLGFILMATVIWLAWVLSVQVGAIGVVGLLGVLLVLGMAGWILGRWGVPHLQATTRRLAMVTATTLALVALAGGIRLVGAVALPTSGLVSEGRAESGAMRWERFSPARVAELRAERVPVFVDFTAAWCLSCQVNERVALGDPRVVREFETLGVVPLKADWTSRDETITRALEEFGRNSVPLYVLYGSDPNAEPSILPEILTPGIVLDALSGLSPLEARTERTP
jgi:thiol:disulfide interchange protein DsbD